MCLCGFLLFHSSTLTRIIKTTKAQRFLIPLCAFVVFLFRTTNQCHIQGDLLNTIKAQEANDIAIQVSTYCNSSQIFCLCSQKDILSDMPCILNQLVTVHSTVERTTRMAVKSAIETKYQGRRQEDFVSLCLCGLKCPYV